MRTDHSPYEGQVVRGWPSLVLARGRVVARDGEFCGEPGRGRYLERAAPDLTAPGDRG
jgi:dihydropyrimidinase